MVARAAFRAVLERTGKNSMSNSIADLLRTEERISQQLKAFFSPLWGAIGTELGLYSGIGAPPEASKIFYHDANVLLHYPFSQQAKTAGKQSRTLIVRIPAEVLESGEEAIVSCLRKTHPIKCLVCGIHHPLGTSRCSGKQCFGSLVWRSEAPRPQYYIELEGGFGYVLPTRGLRFAYDLEEKSLIRIEVVGRHSGHWMTPSLGYIEREMKRFQMNILPYIPDALLGSLVSSINPSRLAYELPDWCRDDVNSMFP